MIFIPKFLICTSFVGATIAFTQYRRFEVSIGKKRRIMKSPITMMSASSASSSRKRTISYAYNSPPVTSTLDEREAETLISIISPPMDDEEQEKETLISRIPPLMDGKIGKLQIEFRELLEGILYTPKEIEAILNPNMRTILEGISASYYEPAVYRAFDILYSDYIPLRIAGRLVYKQLRRVMDESKQYQESQIQTAMKRTGMSRSTVEDCWSTFIQMTVGQTLSLEELQSYTGPQTSNSILSSNGSVLTKDDDSISFEQLLAYLYNNNSKYNNVDCDDDINNNNDSKSKNKNVYKVFNKNMIDGNIIQQALNLNVNNDVARRRKFGDNLKRKKYIQRYNDMLIVFDKWRPLVPSGDEGRRLQILKGCFVGSENDAVVKALRIIYVDYRALRLSGDWIFRVVSTLMGPIVQRHERRTKIE